MRFGSGVCAGVISAASLAVASGVCAQGIGIATAAEPAVFLDDSTYGPRLGVDARALDERVDEDTTYAFGSRVDIETDRAMGGPFRVQSLSLYESEAERAFAVTRQRDSWRQNADGSVEHFRVSSTGTLRNMGGGGYYLGPSGAGRFEPDSHAFSYTRGFAPARGYTRDGLEVEFVPHAGISVSSDGSAAEAGATLRVGENLEGMVRDGDEAFGDRGRWYLFAAGSRRAVGYNFARTRDGDFERAGMSHDSGAFIGDAQVGVAWRRGNTQASFGYVHREIRARELRRDSIDREQSEGMVAFQFSIRPGN
ncbi:MAG: lipid A-modifier LpxR family protein [Brevundimonas sp.]|jgi:hypothetical protein|uniref:lipid A-modifier LpxR family protein n=1 Tax=Brevundimonas sp. TaxID=1871086 RepID=UPI00391C72CC